MNTLEETKTLSFMNKVSPSELLATSHFFKREGFVKVSDAFSWEIRKEMKLEALRLLDLYAERRDLKLKTTGDTPRRMSVVTSQNIAENSTFIQKIYHSKELVNFLESIVKERLFHCPSKDEEFLITLQEKPGDTHGWHWGDYRYAMIWILEIPPIEHGGMLQCVPHTSWNKSDPKINFYLCENAIRTYGFVSGDVYLLKSDTTLHRTVPLSCDATRIMLNMTWGCVDDMAKGVDNDRWWAEKEVGAALYDKLPLK
jgi:hypothetical protein